MNFEDIRDTVELLLKDAANGSCDFDLGWYAEKAKVADYDKDEKYGIGIIF